TPRETPGERMWCRASICQWPRIQAASWAGGGLAGGQAGDGVDGEGGEGAPFLHPGQGADPAGDAGGPGGMREGQPGRNGGGLHGAVLLAAVPAVALAVTGRDVTPGQVF